MINLKGHAALITGSTQGIGRAIAEAFAQAGADVVLHGLSSGADADGALAACRRHGLSEEHGEIELRGEPVPKLGSRIVLIPNHICPCINLHDRIWFREDDGRFTRGVIDARGKIH